MKNTYLFAFFVMFICVTTLIKFKAYPQLLVAILLIAFYLIVVESGKFPKLREFVNDAF